MKMAILTGGGDVPGLNPAIKAAVNRITDSGIEMVGIRRGWAGLLYYNPDKKEPQTDWVRPLTRQDVRTIDRSGGTYLHSSRTNPGKVRENKLPDFLKGKYAFSPNGIADCTDHVLRVLDHLEIGALLAIGGDDTLSYALRLHQEKFPVVGIPKTMDNDVFGTDYCIGFSTAVSRSIAFINDLRTPTGSHERIAVVELFGRNSGETALIAGYLGDADRIVIPEVPFDPERLAALVMEDKRRNPSNYAIVAVSEGATLTGGRIFEAGPEDAYGHRKLGGIGQATGEALKELTGEEIINQTLGYLMRSGPPDSLDRMVAFSYANIAADMALRGETGRMVALHEGIYTTVPLDLIGTGVRRVDVEQLYDAETYRAKVAHLVGKPMFLY
ncbi:MAG: pyrophosphate-dependent phosphofructokinase [Chloroflexi bacterium]|nr:pyrophosphate-dependent phosphofructokinase [Chloroflexota bacterium]